MFHGILSIKFFGALKNLFGVVEKEVVALGPVVVLDALLQLEVPLAQPHFGAVESF